MICCDKCGKNITNDPPNLGAYGKDLCLSCNCEGKSVFLKWFSSN